MPALTAPRTGTEACDADWLRGQLRAGWLHDAGAQVATDAGTICAGRLLGAVAFAQLQELDDTSWLRPSAGEIIGCWSRRMLLTLGLPAALWETRDDIDGLVAAPLAGLLRADGSLVAQPPGELEAALSLNVEGAGDRRRAGTVYTAVDVTRYIAGSTVLAALLERWGVASAIVDQAITDNRALLELVGECIAGLGDLAAAARAERELAALSVLDPTCGSGAFLLEADALLANVGELLDHRYVELGGQGNVGVAQANVFGVDVDVAAVEACRMRLVLGAWHRQGGAGAAEVAAAVAAGIVVGDVVARGWWAAWFPLVMGSGGFAAIVGNPPYVRHRHVGVQGEEWSPRTANCGNLYALVSERAFSALRPGGRLGLIIPVSALCADAFEPYRALWRAQCETVWASSYDTVPSTLFAGTVQRLAILLGRSRARGSVTAATWHVTRYHKWLAAECPALFGQLEYVPLPAHNVNGSLAKIGSSVEAGLLDRLFAQRPVGELLVQRGGDGSNRFWYKRRWSYFLFFVDFMPEIYDAGGLRREPSEFKTVDVVADLDRRVLLALLNSSLFYWYFTVFSDNRNVNVREIAAFRFNRPTPQVALELVALADELMRSLRENSELRTCTYRSVGTIRNQYFFQAATRPVLDRIDALLARHYGFSAAQLEFLMGYEHAFRARVAPGQKP